MENKKSSVKQWHNWLFWLIPPAILAFSPVLLKADAPAFIRWYLVFFLLSLVFMPLSSVIFSKNRDRGYAFSKPLSMAIAGSTVWTLSYLHILAFRTVFIVLTVIFFFALFLFLRKTRESFLDTFESPKTIRLMAIEESIFAGGLLFWSFVRGLKPVLDSLEKPMDYGFMMSLMRTDFLPAKDMWYSIGDINYYYFGQYIYTFMTKLAGMHPELTYNLSMGATFALTLSLSFALCYMFIELGMKRGLVLFKGAPLAGGILGGAVVTLGGNSHSFFYGTHYSSSLQKTIRAPGYRLLEFLNSKGLLEKWTPPAADMTGADTRSISIDGFWFANSTRYIGHNPTTHDKTIHEFPYYSFLVADLHAHLINLAFVLLLLGLLTVLVNSGALKKAAQIFSDTHSELDRTQDKGWLRKEFIAITGSLKSTVTNPIFLVITILLGIFMMCNFWDFAIYIVVISMTLLIVNLRGYKSLASWETIPVFLFQLVLVMIPFLFISHPAIAVLGYAVCAAASFSLLILRADAFTITGAQISLLFFLSHLFVLPFNWNFEPISKSISLVQARTPLFQFAILWIAHIAIGALFLLYIIRKRAKEGPRTPGKGPVSSFLLGMNLMDLFIAGLFVCGLMFLVMPEIIYVVDIYSGDHKRANTMFKFTYQAFVMLSLVIGYVVTRLAMTKPGKSRVDYRWSFVSVFMIILLMLPMHYPALATAQWIGELKRENYKGLNGVAGLPRQDTVEAIDWINENIQGQPVLLEAYGDSYTEYCYLTAYTGLRTIIGWQTHEWLWRTSKYVTNGYGEIVVPKQTDVRDIYEFNDPEKAKGLIHDYNVEYIAVGQNERAKFPGIDEDSLKELGTIIYSNDSVYIIKVS